MSVLRSCRGIAATIVGVLLVTGLAAAPALAASYSVVQGDTYWSLAQRLGTSVAALEAANPTHPARALYPGLILQLPSDGGAPAGAVSATDIGLLARIAAAEEGNRPFADQAGVAAVVLNRVASRDFPNTVRGVIFQPGQFTPVSNGYFWDAVVSATSRRAASAAATGYDPTGGALYFYDPGQGVDSGWIYNQPVTAEISGTVYAR